MNKKSLFMMLLMAVFAPLALNAQTTVTIGNGTLSVPATAGWVTIDLDTPFAYDGTSNLLMGFNKTDDSSWFGDSTWQYTSAAGMARYTQNDNNLHIDNVSIDYSPACPKPTGLSVGDVTAHTAQLNWTSDADAWQICLNDNEDDLIDVNTNPYTLENLADDATYIVKVRANCGNDGYSEWSNEVYWTTLIACPAPTGLAATEITGHTAQLNWTGYSEGYNVYYRTKVYVKEGGLFEDFNTTNVRAGEWTTATTDTTTYTLTGLNPETDYEVKVASSCPNETSHETAIVSFTTDVACPAPTGLAVTNVSPNSAELSWTSGADAWEVEVTNDQEPPVIIIWPANTNPFTVPSLSPETTYTVRVHANCGDEGYSEWSNPVTFTTLEACPVPENLAVSDITYNSATVAWIGYSDSYEVSYRTAAYVAAPFKQDFENELGEWTFTSMNAANDIGGTGTYPAGIYPVAAHSDAYGFRFSSYSKKNSDETYDQYLVSPELTVTGELKFYFKKYNTSAETLYFGYSTTTNDLDAFTWTEDLVPTQEWQEYTQELPTDVKYIAFHYFGNCTYYVYVDDITIGAYDVPAGEWETVEATESPVTLTGLTPETLYEVKVQGICDDFTTPWSWTDSFTTTEVTTYTKTINAYPDESQSDGWYLIASPIALSIPVSEVGYMTDNQFDLYRFNQAPAVNSEGAYLEWENYKSHTTDFLIESGIGYLYANSGNVTLTFTGDAYDNVSEYNKSIPLSKTDANGNPNEKMRGWNLVGNPYSVKAYLDCDFYVMNPEGSEIIASDDRNYIEPMEGAFVLAENDGDLLTFHKTPVASTGDQGSLSINVMEADNHRGNSLIDRAVVRFGEGKALPKFQIRDNSTKIYIPQGGQDYAIARVGRDAMHCVSTETPVNFKAAKNGTYTLTVNVENMDLDYLHLIDNLTGADVDLLGDARQGDARQGDARHCVSTYTFAAKTTDYASRFRLIFNAEDASAGSASDAPFAYINNGNIIITADAGDATLQIVDVMGRVVLCRDAMPCVSTNGMAPGMYVLRLIDGDSVRIQKIVVR